MIFYNKPTVTLEYNETKKQLMQTWTGFSTSVQFREAIDKTVSFVESNQVDSIISDTLKQHVVKHEDTEYASSAIPNLFQNGIKAMAFILPENAFTKLSVKRFDNLIKSYNVNFFASIVEANQWIDEGGN